MAKTKTSTRAVAPKGDIARVSKVMKGQKMDRFDRIRLHMAGSLEELNEDDALLLERALYVYPLMCEGYTDQEIVKLLGEEKQIKQRRCYQVIRDTKMIFADVSTRHKDAEKDIIREMAKKAYRVALAEGDGRAMTSAAKLLAQIEGVFNNDYDLKELYATLSLPTIEFTSDAKILDTPFEVVGDE